MVAEQDASEEGLPLLEREIRARKAVVWARHTLIPPASLAARSEPRLPLRMGLADVVVKPYPSGDVGASERLGELARETLDPKKMVAKSVPNARLGGWRVCNKFRRRGLTLAKPQRPPPS